MNCLTKYLSIAQMKIVRVFAPIIAMIGGAVSQEAHATRGWNADKK